MFHKLIFSNHLSLRVKILLYKVILRPGLLHGAPIFQYMYKSTLNKLQQLQNKYLKYIAINTSLQKLPANQLRKRFKIDKIARFIRRRHIKFYSSLKNIDNPLFSSLHPNFPSPTAGRNITRHPVNILNTAADVIGR